jgi:hypothetical protein
MPEDQNIIFCKNALRRLEGLCGIHTDDVDEWLPLSASLAVAYHKERSLMFRHSS